MEMRSRLFQMMKSGDPRQGGVPWFMAGVVARGGTARPLRRSTSLWAPVAGIATLCAAIGTIWGWGFRTGAYSLAFANMATLLVAGIAAACLVRLACIRVTGRARDDQPR